MFTATATLDADFRDASAEGSIVSGSITGFQAGATSTEGWNLSLGASSDFSSNAVTGAFRSTSRIAGVDVSGDWGATLYGVDNPGYTAATNDDPDNKPAGATCGKGGCEADVAGLSGWFRASGSGNAAEVNYSATPAIPAVVSIAGAFAAK